MYGFGYPGVFVWAVLLPVSFAFVIYNGAKRKLLDNVFFIQSWGFFYN